MTNALALCFAKCMQCRVITPHSAEPGAASG